MKQPIWLDLGSGCPYRGSKHSSKRMQKVGIKQSHHFCGVSLQVVASALVSSIFVGVFLRAPWIRHSQWMPLHVTLINSLDWAPGTLLEISKLEDAHVALAEGELGRRVRCLDDFVCFLLAHVHPLLICLCLCKVGVISLKGLQGHILTAIPSLPHALKAQIPASNFSKYLVGWPLLVEEMKQLLMLVLHDLQRNRPNDNRHGIFKDTEMS